MSSTTEKDMRGIRVVTADHPFKEVEITDHQDNRQNTRASKHITLISVLLVDDHALMRAGLRQLLSLEKDIAVIGEACDGFDAIQQIRQLRPAIVLLDIHLPVIDGITLTRQITREFPNTAVIILSMHQQQQQVLQAVKNGAKGYLLKTSSIREVTDTIRKVSTGVMCIENDLPSTAVINYRHIINAKRSEDSDPIEQLTEKEQEIIRHLVDGMNNREIADKLAYSEKTVKNYLSNIFQKLNLRDRTQVAIFALRHGIIPERYL